MMKYIVWLETAIALIIEICAYNKQQNQIGGTGS